MGKFLGYLEACDGDAEGFPRYIFKQPYGRCSARFENSGGNLVELFPKLSFWQKWTKKWWEVYEADSRVDVVLANGRIYSLNWGGSITEDGRLVQLVRGHKGFFTEFKNEDCGSATHIEVKRHERVF